ncbi:MAG: M48 family metallopeptidase [Nitrospinaceae bacterium]
MVTRLKFLAAAWLLIVAACVTTPESQKSAFIVIPLSQEISMGRQAYQEILQKNKESPNKRWVTMTRRVGKGLAAKTSMPNLEWEFKLIESKEQNAFALPGGKTAVYTGILKVCENEAGLAAVLGHEIAHVTARHGAQRISQQFLIMGAMTVASISLANKDHRQLILGALGLGTMYGISLPFSRANESEADEIGLIYMARAGYDPREAVRFWTRFSQVKKGQQVPEFLSTHPADTTRISRLQRYMPRALREYRGARVQYRLGERFYPESPAKTSGS